MASVALPFSQQQQQHRPAFSLPFCEVPSVNPQVQQQRPHYNQDDSRSRTTQPIVTGTSVLGIKYKDGVMLVADTLCSYGSMAMFKQVERIHKISDNTMIGASGEYSDLQEIVKRLTKMVTNDFVQDDGFVLQPAEIFSYLHRLLYSKRSKADPFYNTILVAGYDHQKNEPFLGAVDLYGTNYMDNMLATGYGAYMALPILRKEWHADMSYADAKSLLDKCMTILFYRDCRTLNSLHLATITKSGATILPAYSLPTQWTFDRFVNPDSTA